MEETRDRIEIGDIMVLLAGGMLSPMIRVLPQRTAAAAEEAGWLAPLAALLPLLAVLACMLWARGRLAEGEGLGDLLVRAFGKVVGRSICGVYLLWLLLELCGALRLYGERFLSTAYRDTPLYLFFVVLLLMELWISYGTLGAFARMGRIFFYVLGITVILAMAFSVGNLESTNLLPIWFDDTPDILRSALPALSNLSVGVFLFFLAGQVSRKPDDRRIVMRWTAGFCVLVSLLSMVVIGCFGHGVAARMQVPFFALVKEIEIYGAIERVESLVVAVWVITDVLLIGLLLRTACAVFRHTFRLEGERRLATPILFFMFPGAFLVAENGFGLTLLYNGIIMAGDLILACGVPVLACLTAKLRKRI